MQKIFTTYARTALKIGLKELGLSTGTTILIPDFICEAVLQPLRQLAIQWRYYALNDDLTPIWSNLRYLVSEGAQAILMVHYFGQPQDIHCFRRFCDSHELILVEDNAHGFGGHFDRRPLGTFGDIGISSPRKILGLQSGGILHWNRNDEMCPSTKLTESKIIDPGYLRRWLSGHPRTKTVLGSVIGRKYVQPNYWDPNASKESLVPDLAMDEQSYKLLDRADMKSIVNSRRMKYSKWETNAIKWGLKPLFKTLHAEANPWLFPAYSSGTEESRYWFDWGWRKGINVHSWPTLPQEQIREQGRAFERWQRLICFPINSIVCKAS